MNMEKWAEQEIKLACKRERGDKPESEWDYGCACYTSALEAFKVLCGQGHSGMSIGFTKHILNRLIDEKPLTPIEDTEDVWNLTHRSGKGKHYQCKRMSSLFKDVSEDGTVKYSDIDRCYCVNKDNPDMSWRNGFVRNIYDEMFPLTMPYMPNDKADFIVCDELLTDRKNGDFDTIAVLYIQRSNGEKIEVNRYFKEGGTSFVEISLEEYKDREKKAKELVRNTYKPTEESE